MDLVFLDPTAEPGLAVTPYELRADLGAGEPSIGLLANSFVDSEEFLRQIARHLEPLVPGISFREYDKTSPTRASEMIDEARVAALRNECTAVITAYGH